MIKLFWCYLGLFFSLPSNFWNYWSITCFGCLMRVLVFYESLFHCQFCWAITVYQESSLFIMFFVRKRLRYLERCNWYSYPTCLSKSRNFNAPPPPHNAINSFSVFFRRYETAFENAQSFICIFIFVLRHSQPCVPVAAPLSPAFSCVLLVLC